MCSVTLGLPRMMLVAPATPNRTPLRTADATACEPHTVAHDSQQLAGHCSMCKYILTAHRHPPIRTLRLFSQNGANVGTPLEQCHSRMGQEIGDVVFLLRLGAAGNRFAVEGSGNGAPGHIYANIDLQRGWRQLYGFQQRVGNPAQVFCEKSHQRLEATVQVGRVYSLTSRMAQIKVTLVQLLVPLRARLMNGVPVSERTSRQMRKRTL